MEQGAEERNALENSVRAVFSYLFLCLIQWFC